MSDDTVFTPESDDRIRDLTAAFEHQDGETLVAMAHDLVRVSNDLDKVFAQTTWLCAMITAIQATLPPPMQQALTHAFQQIQLKTGAPNNGG